MNDFDRYMDRGADRYQLPRQEVREVFARDMPGGCVYCCKTMNYTPDAKRGDKPTIEHFASRTWAEYPMAAADYNDVRKIGICCGSCNSSHQGPLADWLDKKGFRDQITEPVKEYLRDGICSIAPRQLTRPLAA
jgi:hypothetical protein